MKMVPRKPTTIVEKVKVRDEISNFFPISKAIKIINISVLKNTVKKIFFVADKAIIWLRGKNIKYNCHANIKTEDIFLANI